MLQNRIKFREIKPSDYTALERIICETWNYERLCSPKTAKALSKLYLASCLAEQTYTCVALNNNVPVGVIMGKNEKTHRISLRYAVREGLAFLAMLMTKEGRGLLKIFGGFHDINKNLLAASPQKFDGELAFFAVRSDQRGTGVGTELFSRLKAYMESQGIASFYLYTDTSCNYGFYEHQGMKRICEHQHQFKAYDNKAMTFYLYGLI